MIYGYIRVSTQEQNLENQRNCILEHYQVDEFVEEKKSGTIDYSKRSLGGLMKKVKQGDTIVTTEISRFGRSLSMIFKIIQELNDKKVHVIAIKNNFEINNNDDKNNGLVSNVLMFAFGLSAQIERDLISERTKMGLSVARSKGKRIGRQKGDVIYNVKLRQYQNEIMQKYNVEKASINSLAKHYEVKWSTMKKFLTVYSKMEKPIKQNIEIKI